MNRNGKIDILYLIGLFLLIGIIIGILEINGVINIRSLFDREGNFIAINYEKELKKMCDKRDTKGIYNNTDYQTYLHQLSKFIDVENKKLDLEIKESWEDYKGMQFCYDGTCYYFVKDNSRKVHIYDCKKRSDEELEFKSFIKLGLKKLELEDVCPKLDNNGNYENEEITCRKKKCHIVFEGKQYYKTCK